MGFHGPNGIPDSRDLWRIFKARMRLIRVEKSKSQGKKNENLLTLEFVW